MKDYIDSPFYSIKNNKLLYLDSYEICELPKEEKIRKRLLIDEGAMLEKKYIPQQKKSALIIEPHPDDFALSALGYTLNQYNAIICNIFTKTDINNFPWIRYIDITENQYEKLRIEESILSIEKLLNQRFITMAKESLRITNEKHDSLKKQILALTKRILEENNVDTLLVPMGIGKHPDHLIAHNSIMDDKNITKNVKIILYPEYPYSRSKKDYFDRINELESWYNLNKIIINIDEDKMNIIANAISAYRSQFDDINRQQMLAIIREDYRSIAQENNQIQETMVLYEFIGEKNENKFF